MGAVTTVLCVAPTTAALGHVPPADHPESPDRLRAALRGAAAVTHPCAAHVVAAPSAPSVADIHGPAWRAVLEGEAGMLPDGETWCGPGSRDAALASAGAAEHLAAAVGAGHARSGLALCRPPGHHAGPAGGSGYCLLNNAVIAIRALRTAGLRRVAVIDLDAHHGDGTEAFLRGDTEALYTSIHEAALFPVDTGTADDQGPLGNLLNFPVDPGAGDADLHLCLTTILAALLRFGPDAVVLSLGVDGHRDDPMSNLRYTTVGLAAAVERIAAFTERYCDGRTLVILEGGYDYPSLEATVAAALAALVDAAEGGPNREATTGGGPLPFQAEAPLPSTAALVHQLAALHPLLRDSP